MTVFSTGVSAEEPAGTGSSAVLDQIKASGVIRLAYRSDAEPFSFLDKANAPTGYSVDLCRAVAAAIKADLQLAQLQVAYVPVSAETRFGAIQQRKADLLCEATTQTLKRRETMDFSIPTFVSSTGLIVKQGGPNSFKELRGKKIGVLAATTTRDRLERYMKDNGLEAEIVTVKSHDEGFKALDAGDIAAYLGDGTILHFRMMQPNYADLTTAHEYLWIEPFSLAMPLDEGFRLSVDRALSRLYREGEIRPLFLKWFGFEAKGPNNVLNVLYLLSGLPE
jgi:polar amino acid transport system substrate-binding protein/glutamate/aspartate transport system substrate-binding protein